MKTRFNLFALSFIAAIAIGSAHADDCTTVAQATPANVYSCTFDISLKAPLVAGWLADPKIQATADFDTLANGLGSFGDATLLNPVMFRVLTDGNVSNGKKALIVRNAGAIDGKLSPQIKAYVHDLFGRSDPCDPIGTAALTNARFFGPKDPTYAKFLNWAMSSCNLQTDAYLVAAGIVGQGYTSGVLALMDRLTAAKTEIDASPNAECANDENAQHWYQAYQDDIVTSLQSLGNLRSERAQNIVESYQNVHCSVMANAARAADANIQTGINLRQIRQGDATAISWGMDMIRDHDGAYATAQNEVLDAFAAAMRNAPSTKTKIKRFLREEYESGYHIGNADLNARLRKMSQ